MCIFLRLTAMGFYSQSFKGKNMKILCHQNKIIEIKLEIKTTKFIQSDFYIDNTIKF